MPTTLTVKPWPDALIDTLGYDPRSRYVETFWLPTLGPPSMTIEPIASRGIHRHRPHRSGVRHLIGRQTATSTSLAAKTDGNERSIDGRRGQAFKTA